MNRINNKIKALSKTQIARAYNVSMWTINVWIKPFESELGTYRGGSYTPQQVKLIFDKLGYPYDV